MAVGVAAGSVARRAAVDFGAPSRLPPPAEPLAPAIAAAGNNSASRPCPELDCVRALLPAAVLAAAAERAAAIGVGADRVLVANGTIAEEDYLRTLGDRLGVAFEPLGGLRRRLCPLDDARLPKRKGVCMWKLS